MMNHPNLDLIDQFFDAYSKRDIDVLRSLLSDDVTWTFPGHHPLSGAKVGVDAIVAFFDAVGSIMGGSNPKIEKLVSGVADQYVVECQQIQTHRQNGPNLDQQMCVLWSFANGKITSGAHMAADQDQLDAFYTALATHMPEGS